MPASVRSILERYGEYDVIGVELYKKPINSYMDQLLNLLSLGQFNVNKQKLDVDKMYHLWMEVKLYDSQSQRFISKPLVIEKNQTVNISTIEDAGYEQLYEDSEHIRAPDPSMMSLNQFVENGIQVLIDNGLKPFNYDGQNNNCQIFVNAMLVGNGIDTPELDKFVLQDTNYIVGNLSSFTKDIMRGAIDAAQAFNILSKGAGFY
jgi:hypothetical protein